MHLPSQLLSLGRWKRTAANAARPVATPIVSLSPIRIGVSATHQLARLAFTLHLLFQQQRQEQDALRLSTLLSSSPLLSSYSSQVTRREPAASAEADELTFSCCCIIFIAMLRFLSLQRLF